MLSFRNHSRNLQHITQQTQGQIKNTPNGNAENLQGGSSGLMVEYYNSYHNFLYFSTRGSLYKGVLGGKWGWDLFVRFVP